MIEEKKNTTNSDELAFYEVVRDSYKQRYKFRSWIFTKILKHMLSKITTEPTIFYLMTEIRKLKKVSKYPNIE